MSVLDFKDLSVCAAKVRQPGYWMRSIVFNKDGVPVPKTIWIADRSTVECKYDRRRVDPACRAANCTRIDAP